jgi:hypothetical protein
MYRRLWEIQSDLERGLAADLAAGIEDGPPLTAAVGGDDARRTS